jgi:nucleoside-diphosphate-sugar epimerase
MPVFVLGRDETVTDASSIAKGTNGLLMGPVLGYAREHPLNGTSVHIDDVAKMHLLALDPKIEGNQDFLAAGPGFGKINWAASFDIIKKRFPKEYAEGVFKFDTINPPPTTVSQVDSGKAAKVLGLDFKSYEEQIVSVVEHYLELLGRK